MEYEKNATKREEYPTDDNIKEIIKNKIQAIYLLKKAYRKRYSELLIGIGDKFALGIDLYPMTPNNAYDIIESYSVTHRIYTKSNSGSGKK